jgi:hypothetical protein
MFSLMKCVTTTATRPEIIMNEIFVASLAINMAETTYVLGAIKHFVDLAAPRYGVSEGYVNDLNSLAEDCKNLWTDEDWDNYIAHQNSEPDARPVLSDALWTFSIVDCDAMILALQFLHTIAVKDASNGIPDSAQAAKDISMSLIPRMANVFSEDEWNSYVAEVERFYG